MSVIYTKLQEIHRKISGNNIRIMKKSPATFLPSLIIGIILLSCSLFYSCNSCSSSDKPLSVKEEADRKITWEKLIHNKHPRYGEAYKSVYCYIADSMPDIWNHVSSEGLIEEPTAYMTGYLLNEYSLIVVLRRREVYRKLHVYSFVADSLISKPIHEISEPKDDVSTNKCLDLFRHSFRGNTLFVITEYNYYVPTDVFGIQYCILDNENMIVFEQTFPGFHILQNVAIEDWDNDGQDDIRIKYSEYTNYHDYINEVVFSLKNKHLYPIFLITLEDVLFYQEGYPEEARYIVREYTKTHSDIVIHENTGTVNLDETSPDFGLKTPMHSRSYKEPIVNKTLSIWDIYPHYIPEDDTEEY